MRTIWVMLSAVALASCSALPFGDDDAPGAQARSSPIAVSNAWASVAPVGAKQAAGFMTITNAAVEDDRLISVSSSRSAHMELHEMGMEGSMTTMRPITGGIPIPAGATVALKPTDMHIMFIDLVSPLSAGDTVPVALTFEKTGVVQVDLPVRTMAAMQ